MYQLYSFVKFRRQKRHAVLLDLKEKPSSSTNDISDSIYKTKHNHLAKSFDDTTDGATHYFYDEHGNSQCFTYCDVKRIQGFCNKYFVCYKP